MGPRSSHNSIKKNTPTHHAKFACLGLQLHTQRMVFPRRKFRCFLLMIKLMWTRFALLTQKPSKTKHLKVKNYHGRTIWQHSGKGMFVLKQPPHLPIASVCVGEEEGMSHAAHVSCTVQPVQAKSSFNFSSSGKVCLSNPVTAWHLNAGWEGKGLGGSKG